MKLRQKLAVILAASAVVTSVPVVTFADTSNSVHNDVYVRDGSRMGFSKSEKDEDGFTFVKGSKILDKEVTEQTTLAVYKINNADNEQYANRYITNLELYPKDNYTITDGRQETFFITLEDGEFSWEAYYLAALNRNGAAFKEMADLGASTKIAIKDDKAVDANGKEVKSVDANGKDISGKVEDAVKNTEILRLVNDKEGTATFTITGSKEMRVDLEGEWVTSSRDDKATPILVPLFVNAKATQVKVKVDGSESFVTTGTYTLGNKDADGKELAVTVDDAATGISVDGDEISKLILSEQVLNAVGNSKNHQIKLELPSSSDAEFSLKGIKAKGARGFAGKEATDLKAEFGKAGRNDDKLDRQTIIITLPEWADNTARGNIELTGIKVVPTDDTIATGDLKVTVSAVDDDDFIKETELTVGKVAEYGVTAVCEKPATIKAGRSGLENDYKVTVELKENVKDSITEDRSVTIALQNGYIISATDVIANATSYKASELGKSYSTKSDNYKQAAKEAIEQLIKDKKIKFESDAEKATIKSVEVNAEGQVTGFVLENLEKVKKDEKDTLKITMPVAAPLSATGEVKFAASGRAFAELGTEKEITCKVADIKSPVSVEMTAAELKVGLQDQATAGKLVIKETDKGMLQKGTIIIDADADVENGIKFQAVPKVEGTGVKIGDVSLRSNKRYLEIEIEKTSTEAGSITISGINFTTDRNVPEGTFDVRFYGDALTDEDIKEGTEILWDKYVVNDFIKITTPNTEDIKNGALKAVTSQFKLDATTYTVDGVEKTMDAPAYAKDGRIMVPLRYVAYAFGLQEDNVLFANSTATVVAGEKVIQVKLGDKNIYVNGTSIPMDAAAEAKGGRIYVPMSYIASALGVTPTWDDATKTATFSNVAK